MLKKNAEVKKTGINLSLLNADLTEEIPETDIRRLVKKLTQAMSIENLHAYCKTVDYMNVEPSPLGIMECHKLVNEFVKTSSALIHPVYVVDNLMVEGDVIFSPDNIKGVVKKEGQLEPVQIDNKMGIYSDSEEDREKAVASSLLALATSRVDDGIQDVYKDSRILEFFCMQPIRLRAVRDFFQDDTKSAVKAREFIYSTLKQEGQYSDIIIDKIYAKMIMERLFLRLDS